MSIGNRIRFLRKKKGFTQKALGKAMGMAEDHSNICINRYESGARQPRRDLLEKMAAALGVSPKALSVPDIVGNVELMHMFFALEDTYGFQVCRSGPFCYFILDDATPSDPELTDFLRSWCSYAEMLKTGQITRAEYDHWRYNFMAPQSKNQTRGTRRK